MMAPALMALAERNVRTFHTYPLLVCRDRIYSNRDIVDTAVSWTGALASRGIGMGSIVFSLLPAGPCVLSALLALTGLSAVMVLLDANHPLPWLKRLAAVAPPDLILAAPEGPVDLEKVGAGALLIAGENEGHLRFGSAGESLCASPGRLPGSPDGPSVVLMTSGTTGGPKLVVLSQRNLITNALDTVHAFRYSHSDRFLCGMPLSHGWTVSLICIAWIAGAQVVWQDSFDPERSARDIARYRITDFDGFPSMYAQMLPALLRAPSRDLSSVRIWGSGGEALPMPLAERFREATGMNMLHGYGLTEASTNVSLHTPYIPLKQGSVGRPIRSCRVRIVDNESRSVPTGCPGRIVVEGPSVMLGYLNQLDETGGGPVDRRLLTGDIGYLDDEGYLYVLGRETERLRRQGEVVYPAAVEECILASGYAHETAVLIADEDGAGPLVAAVAVRAALPSRDVLDALVTRMLGHAYRPDRWVLVRGSLPRTHSGKVDRTALIDLAHARLTNHDRRGQQPVGKARGDGPDL